MTTDGKSRAASVEAIEDKIQRWRATAHYYALYARARFDDEDHEGAAGASSLAAMYLALALDADHFGELPKPERPEA